MKLNYISYLNHGLLIKKNVFILHNFILNVYANYLTFLRFYNKINVCCKNNLKYLLS